MTAEMKAKWLEALRSGKYKQGRNLLRNGDKYCCLGVLCDIDGAEWKLLRPGLETTYTASGRDAFEGNSCGKETALLSTERMLKIGIRGEITNECIKMNDDGNSFAEIADWLEENLPVSA